MKQIAATIGRTEGSVQWRLAVLRASGVLRPLPREEWNRRARVARDRWFVARREAGAGRRL